MGFDRAMDVVRLLAIVALCAHYLLRGRIPSLRRHNRWVLAALAATALLAHVNFLRFHGETGHVHDREIYHYLVGAKYFPELGYTGLYEATVVADLEDDPGGFHPNGGIRDLRDKTQLRSHAETVRRSEQIKAAFSADRWAEFKRDIAVFRGFDRRVWRTNPFLHDHGYNGTPLHTAVLGGLASLPLADTATFIEWAAALDLILLLLVVVIIGRLLGAEEALVFLFFWSVNPFNEYLFIGGSFLRYAYLDALVLGIVLYRTGHQKASGVLLAVSALLRVFPVLFYLVIAGHQLLQPNRRALVRAHARFHAAFFATCVALLAATSLVRTPSGGNAWVEFGERISVHHEKWAPNNVGARYFFLYSHQHNVEKVLASWPDGERLNWVTEAKKTYQERKVGYYAFALLAVVGIFLYLRRVAGPAAFLAALALVFVAAMPSHYYYAMLCVLPLIALGRVDAQLLLGAGCAVVLGLRLVPGLQKVPDLQYLGYSVALCALLGSMAWLLARRPLTGDRE